jgi:hypothetical protein
MPSDNFWFGMSIVVLFMAWFWITVWWVLE